METICRYCGNTAATECCMAVVFQTRLTTFQVKLAEALVKAESHKPFVGIPEKDYYRGQWDALEWVREELFS